MSYPHWDYFLSLETDLINLARYIEFSEENYNTYSIELVRILLAASSEIDVVAKLLCQQLDPEFSPRIESEDRKPNINDYRKTIQKHRPVIAEFRAEIPRYGLTLLPWGQWYEGKENPDWWSAHNKVKHRRNDNFQQANLENTLNSVAGLFAIVLNLYWRESYNRKLYPDPSLFKSSWFKSQIMTYSEVEEAAKMYPGSGVGLTQQ